MSREPSYLTISSSAALITKGSSIEDKFTPETRRCATPVVSS